MKNWTKGLITAACLLAGSAAIAQDASNPPDANTTPSSMPSSTTGPGATATGTDTSTTASKKQQLKDCMAKMEAKNDGSTKVQMKKACKDEMKGADSMSHQ